MCQPKARFSEIRLQTLFFRPPLAGPSRLKTVLCPCLQKRHERTVRIVSVLPVARVASTLLHTLQLYDPLDFQALLPRDIQLRQSQCGYWGPPVHNMGPCSRPGEDPNAWKIRAQAGQ